MNEQIALSIIVPVYNLEAFLPETLESLLKIDFEAPYEIIAVDDGSSDGSLAVLRAYEKESKAIRVITGPNGGVSRARNAGIEAARGKYLAFADGDDTVEPGFFAAAVREMEEGGYGLVQGNAARHVAGHGASAHGCLVARGEAGACAPAEVSGHEAAVHDDGVAHGAARALAARGLEDDGLAAYAHAVLEGHAGPGDATAGVGFDRAGVDGHHVAGDRSVGQPARQQARQGAAGDDDAVALGKAVGPAAHGTGNGA